MMMDLKKFRETDKKKISIIIFTVCCIFLIAGVYFYKTFAAYLVSDSRNVIEGTVQDPGDLYFVFYVDGSISKTMPNKEDGYKLDSTLSTCTNGATPVLDGVNWTVQIQNLTTTRTKCTLYFVPKTELAINYELNGGSWVSGYTAPSVHTIGASTTLPINDNVSYLTDYYLEGWYETSDFSTSKLTTIDSTRKADVQLYAKWGQKITITVNVINTGETYEYKMVPGETLAEQDWVTISGNTCVLTEFITRMQEITWGCTPNEEIVVDTIIDARDYAMPEDAA